MNITIFGKGNIAAAIAKNFETAGNVVKYVVHETDAKLDEIIVLAVPYPAVDDVINRFELPPPTHSLRGGGFLRSIPRLIE
jgi:8-hydroxy-5-deazaflavin:NADPH oxidoreductase